MEGSDPTQAIPSSGQSDDTDEFDAPRHPFRPTYLALIFCVVAAGGFLAGIAVAAASRPQPVVVGRVNAQDTIGPSGGTIRFDDGQLEIPPGALAQPVHIVIRRSSFTDRVRVLPPAGSAEVFDPGGLAAYTFTPAGLTFRRPVHIVFRLPAGARNGTAFVRNGNDIVILGGTVDTDRDTVTVTVRNFRNGSRTKR